MAEDANNHFNSYIPDKYIEEQLLTENPVPSNLQQVKLLDDLIRSFYLHKQSRHQTIEEALISM